MASGKKDDLQGQHHYNQTSPGGGVAISAMPRQPSIASLE
ncbi:hypothetical protein COLO4_03199 [Corchorus olitorius]|uniref:Uncharacterized protein n=1 Tax=Corchorus olitorius TaxID=93759 RepID=A0A1R3KZC4_9ROSI|nr:hypothetical protein COLO4_03199 [Corchorus olitorius]